MEKVKQAFLKEKKLYLFSLLCSIFSFFIIKYILISVISFIVSFTLSCILINKIRKINEKSETAMLTFSFFFVFLDLLISTNNMQFSFEGASHQLNENTITLEELKTDTSLLKIPKYEDELKLILEEKNDIDYSLLQKDVKNSLDSISSYLTILNKRLMIEELVTIFFMLIISIISSLNIFNTLNQNLYLIFSLLLCLTISPLFLLFNLISLNRSNKCLIN